MIDLDELRAKHDAFWDKADSAQLTRDDELEYWEMCADTQPELIDRLQRAEMEVVAWRDNSNSWQEQCERAEATLREILDSEGFAPWRLARAYFAANEKEKS